MSSPQRRDRIAKRTIAPSLVVRQCHAARTERGLLSQPQHFHSSATVQWTHGEAGMHERALDCVVCKLLAEGGGDEGLP